MEQGPGVQYCGGPRVHGKYDVGKIRVTVRVRVRVGLRVASGCRGELQLEVTVTVELQVEVKPQLECWPSLSNIVMKS